MKEKLISPPWPGWETVKFIDSGSYGSVYEIKRINIKDKAAMKVISIPQKASEIKALRGEGYSEQTIRNRYKEYKDKVINEYALMRSVTGSSNIVNCDDYGEVQHEDGIGWDIYLRMELLTPLTESLSNTISEGTVIKVAEDLCRALVICKKHNIIHRDIKPSNIFVSENGDYKLGDFGIAKTIDQTMSGTMTGTYSYMAPEVIKNEKYGSAADIYSLGLVLYWLLNERRLPFLPLPPKDPTHAQEEEAKARRFNGEKLLAPKNGEKWLKEIVLKACAYKPEERFASAQEMLESIKSKKIIKQVYNNDDLTVGTENHYTDTDEGTIGRVVINPPPPPPPPTDWKKIIIAVAAMVLILAVTLSTGSVTKKPEPTPKPTSKTTTISTPKPVVWSEWSGWSSVYPEMKVGREIDTREKVIGYNMVVYVTQDDTPPHPRTFRDYSIKDNLAANGARVSYSEKCFELYVSADVLRSSKEYGAEVPYIDDQHVHGVNKVDKPVYLIEMPAADGRYYPFFVKDKVFEKEYRYRDIIK